MSKMFWSVLNETVAQRRVLEMSTAEEKCSFVMFEKTMASDILGFG